MIISIVTVSFNQGNFIEETIRSVLSQEGDFYIDYIIIDGESTDNSVDIIKEYQRLISQNGEPIDLDGLKFYRKSHPYFQLNNCAGISYRWVSEQDRNQVDALKKGFRQARGDVYCWLNSDDYYLNQFVLKKVTAYFDGEPGLKLLFGDGVLVSKDGNEIALHHTENINVKELLFLDYHILQPASFFSAGIYNENYLDEQYICAFDADFFIRFIIEGGAYKKVTDSFAAFRFYHENKTVRLSRKKSFEQLQIARKYHGNYFHYLVSLVYRWSEIILKPNVFQGRRFKRILFLIIKRMSYLLITGKFTR